MGGGEYDAGASGDLREGTMRSIAVQECKVLLARVGGAVRAIGDTCPHAGAPLSEGVLQGSRVTCPWHKAAFNVADGRCLAAPAVDDLPYFAAREVDGRILVTLPGHMAPAANVDMTDTRCMVIVGGGAAATSAVQTLRQQGFGGRVIMIGREDRLPYDRTVLSKYALSGEHGAEKTPLHEGYFFTSHAIERMCAEVSTVDLQAQSLRLADGRRVQFDQLLMATGSAPRHLEADGAALPGVFMLRSAADAEAIATATADARRCVVIGAGFIGMEVAAALRERGLSVHVVAPQQTPFQTQLGGEVGDAVAGLHREKGIVFHMGRQVAALAGTDRVSAAVLDDGTKLDADLVIVGLGVTPETAALDGVPHEDDGSVTVDAGMQVSPGLYAAGDIATFPLYGSGPPVRVEHWRVAQQQGRIAALNMLGRNERYSSVPVFWTIHFRKRLDYVGHAKKWDEVHIDGDPAQRDFLAFYLQSGKVAALAGMNRDRQMAASIQLFEQRQGWTMADMSGALAAFRSHDNEGGDAQARRS